MIIFLVEVCLLSLCALDIGEELRTVLKTECIGYQRAKNPIRIPIHGAYEIAAYVRTPLCHSTRTYSSLGCCSQHRTTLFRTHSQ